MNQKRTPKKPPKGDWHPADIKAALEKAGWSLRRLSLYHGYSNGSTLRKALSFPWSKGEKLIADALGLHPNKIWPSRYINGAPKNKSRNGCAHIGRQSTASDTSDKNDIEDAA